MARDILNFILNLPLYLIAAIIFTYCMIVTLFYYMILVLRKDKKVNQKINKLMKRLQKYIDFFIE